MMRLFALNVLKVLRKLQHTIEENDSGFNL
jgi:hypothetical protein